MSEAHQTSAPGATDGQVEVLLNAWLASLERKGRAEATIATYRREVRRIAWYCEGRSTPAPWLWKDEDALRYVQFLREEAHLHVCPAGRQFGSPDWTPFRAGRLSQSARDSATRIASLLWDYLVVTRHAQANPFLALVRKASEESAPRQADRGAVPPNVLDLVLTCMDRRPKPTAKDIRIYWRNRFVLLLYCGTGLRATEGVCANMSDIHPLTDPQTGRTHWALQVRGKDLPLDATVLDALRSYRLAFQLPPMPIAREELGLILSPFTPAQAETQVYGSARSRRGRGMWKSIRTRQTIRNIVRDEFDAAAAALPKQSPEAALLARASTQWLRHTRGAMLAAAGVDVPLVARAMRYSNVRTAKAFADLDFFDIARLAAGEESRVGVSPTASSEDEKAST